MLKFPFNRDVDQYSRNLWNKDTYIFLARFFEGAAMDSQIACEDGVPLYNYCYDGKNWTLPGASNGTTRQSTLTATSNGSLITVSSGSWTHRYTVSAIDAETFWHGDPADLPTGATQLAAGWNYVYVEFNGTAVTWGNSSTYPAQATNIIRRCIFSIELEADAMTVATALVSHNTGDIYS